LPSSNPEAAEPKQPAGAVPKRRVTVSLNEEEYERAVIAARTHQQTVEEWIADMVYTSTQP
jgi:hypothetical protein